MTTPGAPLEGATVQVGDFVLETDGDGLYEWWLEEGTYPITVSADGYVTQTGEVVVVAGEITTTDFTLRLDAACADVTPDSLEAELPLGDSTDLSLTVTNTGAAAYEFGIGERDLGREILSLPGAPVQRISAHVLAAVGGGRARSGACPGRAHPGVRRSDAPWTDIAGYPFPWVDNTAAVFDGKMYSVAGIDGALSFLDDLFVYDPAGDTWTQLASLSIAREKPAAAFVDGLLYVTGGWDSFGGNVSALEIYEPATDTWSAGADVPAAYAAAAAVSLDGQLYLIGGCDILRDLASTDGVGLRHRLATAGRRRRPIRGRRRGPRAVPSAA